MIQFDEYYKSLAVGVTSEIGLLLTNVLQSSSVSASASVGLRNTVSFIHLRYRKSHGTSHYTTYIYFKRVEYRWIWHRPNWHKVGYYSNFISIIVHITGLLAKRVECSLLPRLAVPKLRDHVLLSCFLPLASASLLRGIQLSGG